MGKKRRIKEYEGQLVYLEHVLLGSFLSARHTYLTGQDDWLKEPFSNHPPVVTAILQSVCVDCVLKEIVESGVTSWDACLSGEISVDEHLSVRSLNHTVH